MALLHLAPIYQTVKDFGTQEFIENNGPIYGSFNTWLGSGYYFWDGAVELAHWWGKVHCKGSYVICEAMADFDQEVFFDLFGSTADLKVFRQIANILCDKHLLHNITVSAVLNQMRKHTSFPYRVIRARSEHNIPENIKMRFVDRDWGYMNTIPAVQICFFDKDCISNYHIVYPHPIEPDIVV